jgi:hypothetical protein
VLRNKITKIYEKLAMGIRVVQNDSIIWTFYAFEVRKREGKLESLVTMPRSSENGHRGHCNIWRETNVNKVYFFEIGNYSGLCIKEMDHLLACIYLLTYFTSSWWNILTGACKQHWSHQEELVLSEQTEVSVDPIDRARHPSPLWPLSLKIYEKPYYWP